MAQMVVSQAKPGKAVTSVAEEITRDERFEPPRKLLPLA
jgi:hypothetical protein